MCKQKSYFLFFNCQASVYDLFNFFFFVSMCLILIIIDDFYSFIFSFVQNSLYKMNFLFQIKPHHERKKNRKQNRNRCKIALVNQIEKFTIKYYYRWYLQTYINTCVHTHMIHKTRTPNEHRRREKKIMKSRSQIHKITSDWQRWVWKPKKHTPVQVRDIFKPKTKSSQKRES